MSWFGWSQILREMRDPIERLFEPIRNREASVAEPQLA